MLETLTIASLIQTIGFFARAMPYPASVFPRRSDRKLA